RRSSCCLASTTFSLLLMLFQSSRDHPNPPPFPTRRSSDLFASTRDARHQKLALELGAAWAGGTFDEPPKKLDAAIVFAPAGEIVPAALKALKKGGELVLGGIHMSPIPSFPYDLLYQERVIRSVANNTRQDGEDFLRIAAEIPIR